MKKPASFPHLPPSFLGLIFPYIVKIVACSSKFGKSFSLRKDRRKRVPFPLLSRFYPSPGLSFSIPYGGAFPNLLQELALLSEIPQWLPWPDRFRTASNPFALFRSVIQFIHAARSFPLRPAPSFLWPRLPFLSVTVLILIFPKTDKAGRISCFQVLPASLFCSPLRN